LNEKWRLPFFLAFIVVAREITSKQIKRDFFARHCSGLMGIFVSKNAQIITNKKAKRQI
jgi:hypothetical protein